MLTSDGSADDILGWMLNPASLSAVHVNCLVDSTRKTTAIIIICCYQVIMASISFPNLYTHRKVAETKAKSCDICYRLSTSVLITPDSKDFFYICPSHLKEPAYCTPKVDTEAIETRKKKELEEEIERVKKEYEEKQNKKKEKGKEAEKEKEKDEKDDEKSKDTDEKKDEKDQEKSKDSRSTSREGTKSPPVEEEPRVFELKPTFYQQRLLKKRQAEIAKRNRERLQDPTFFPSVPKNLP